MTDEPRCGPFEHEQASVLRRWVVSVCGIIGNANRRGGSDDSAWHILNALRSDATTHLVPDECKWDPPACTCNSCKRGDSRPMPVRSAEQLGLPSPMSPEQQPLLSEAERSLQQLEIENAEWREKWASLAQRLNRSEFLLRAARGALLPFWELRGQLSIAQFYECCDFAAKVGAELEQFFEAEP